MLINKKVTCMILLLMGMVLIPPLNCFALNNSKRSDVGKMVVYSVNSTVFRQFINTPSLEILNKQNSETIIQSFFISNKGDDYIKRETRKNNTIQIDDGKSGVMRIGTLPVYIEFIKFMESKNNFEAILEKNNIDENIDYYCIIDNQSSAQIPLSIWIKTLSGNYFLTINESLEDYENNPNSTEFVYRFYNYTDYCKKFGLNNGSLIVNGEDISNGNYVKFENDTVYLPFRAVVEKLGYVVGWDEKNCWATFSNKSGVQYVLRINTYPYLVEKSNANSSGYVPPGDNLPFCCIIDNRTIVDERLMKEIVTVLCATVDVDYENLSVTINNQLQW